MVGAKEANFTDKEEKVSRASVFMHSIASWNTTKIVHKIARLKTYCARFLFQAPVGQARGFLE